MLRTFLVGCAFTLLSAVSGVAAADPSGSTSRGFVVLVDRGVTKESVIPAILAAGRAELVAACETNPGASIRIDNPMASGDHVDLSCAAVLGGDEEATGQTAAALTRAPGAPSEGATGEARQRLTPLGPILCGLTGLITSAAQDRVCRDWRGRDSEFCNVGTFGSSSLWLLACAIAF
jgi:hypothetical protein